MTDRELLELAARAVGLDYVCWMSGAMAYRRNGNLAKWNPLTEDGDALRLAVDLDIIVTPWDSAGMTATQPPIEGIDIRVPWDETDGDKYAATRRAIVLAAAEIGREK